MAFKNPNIKFDVILVINYVYLGMPPDGQSFDGQPVFCMEKYPMHIKLTTKIISFSSLFILKNILHSFSFCKLNIYERKHRVIGVNNLKFRRSSYWKGNVQPLI